MEFDGTSRQVASVEFFALLLILLSYHVSSQMVDDVELFKLWPEGKPIPYEISKQYSNDESALIKAALVEIMNSTCIKFVPRTKAEEDYIVFVEFKALNQTRGTCWSGKWEDMGSEFGFQKGRHVISLWRDLGCFNKFNIIYEVLRILGFDSFDSGNRGAILNINGKHQAFIHAILRHSYEKQGLGPDDPTTYLRISCDADTSLIRRHPYAFDLNLKNKTKTFVGKNSCNQLEGDIQLLTQDRLSIINTVYECNNATYKKMSDIGNDSADGNCHDESAKCLGWSESGECKSNPRYMLWNCRASCKQCKIVEKVRFSDANCRDENENCPQWAATGGCKNNPNYMLWKCRASCKRCKSSANSSVISKAKCKDENENCPSWADDGECQWNTIYMLWNCKSSCKQCETGKTEKLVCTL